MLLFDFDGVIADTQKLCLAACDHAAKVQTREVSVEQTAFEALNPLTFEALAEILSLNPTAFVGDVADYVGEHLSEARPFEGMPVTLNKLAQFHRLAVVSASRSSVLNRFLAAHGLSDCFSRVIGGDTPGSKSEKIGSLIRSISDERNAMIGDAGSDMQAAIDNGIDAIGVSWGWQSADRLLEAGALRVLETPEQLIEEFTSQSESEIL